MTALTLSTHFRFNPRYSQRRTIPATSKEVFTVKFLRTRGRTSLSPSSPSTHQKLSCFRYDAENKMSDSTNFGGDAENKMSGSTNSGGDAENKMSGSTNSGDAYVALFVRMLGLDNDPLDREQAIVALWQYSLGGKEHVDVIMQFHGCVNLTVNLLKSESSSACEAAAGLLRSISSINTYRDLVAESGAIEEITGLLSRSSLSPEVKEQSICTLWNLSVDEKLRQKITNMDILPLIIKSLDDEDLRVKEAAGGLLANLALSHFNHSILVEAGIIPKLAELLKTNSKEIVKRDNKGFKVIKKEARNALLELAKDEYYKILIIEEGLVPVPLIGAAAYRSFQPGLYSWPSLPDGTEIERSPKISSKYGASELLLGLNIDDKKVDIDETKVNAIVGRTHQQFLARIGAIEREDEERTQHEVSHERRITLLPWMDGVARLVLILGLEDELAILRAAESIADTSINEHMRISFKEAGAIKHLVRLMNHKNDDIKLAVTRALERLSVSNKLCRAIEAEGVLYPLISILKHSENLSLVEKTLDILARILDPTKEMKSKFYGGPVNGSEDGLEAARGSEIPKEVLDSCVIARLVEILKTSSPNVQRKTAAVLEYVSIIEPSMESIMSVDIESGLDAVFQQEVLNEMESGEGQQLELGAVVVEETGLAISAASRLLTKLLESDQFCRTINATHFVKLLRRILKSGIPLHCKDWVAACLVKLSSLSRYAVEPDSPINKEVALYETIPRLIEQITSSFSLDTREAAAVELNRIVSEGFFESTQAIASKGGIYPLVKMIEEGSERAVDASLAILYSLSMDSDNHSAILAAGAVPALRRIVFSQRPQWKRALRLLRTLPV